MSTSCLIQCRRVVLRFVDELSHKCVDELFCRRVVSIPTWGRFLSKAEPEVHLCGEFDFVTPRISEFAPMGNLVFGSEE